MSDRIPATNIPVQSVAPAHTHDPIVTKRFRGFYRNLRITGGVLLFGLYFVTVWLTWDGRQAVLWDISERQFHIFGATFWPEDLTLLTGGLVICAFGLFFITVLAGRVWCGYSCPQSMWTWLFLWVEQFSEGDRNQRIKLARGPWTVGKLLRRGQKHALWLLISLVTALTFVGYFTPIQPLLADVLALEAGAMTLFWLFFFTAATYLNAGWLREKVCLHMCPYGRFQSVMLDDDSLVISYDAKRGDPRGHRRREVVPSDAGLGDCIDCQQCVQVCPTGIDIREGLQMECIGCAACIDVCDSVMDKVGYEPGLIRYASKRQLAGGPLRLWRPRLLGYAAVLLAMVLALVWGVATRDLVSLEVAKDRSLFRYNAAGQVENSYQLKVLNKASEPRTLQLAVTGPGELAVSGLTRVRLDAGQSRELNWAVAVAPDNLTSVTSELVFTARVEGQSGQGTSRVSRFTGPGGQ